jgi:hypothetical protein
MAQRISDGFERYPLVQQANGKGMAQAIRPLARKVQTTTPEPMVEDVVHAGGIQPIEWSAHAQEKLASLTSSTTFLQVTLQYVPDFIGQRQNQMLVGLALPDSQNTGLPVNIVQSQCDHLAAA